MQTRRPAQRAVVFLGLLGCRDAPAPSGSATTELAEPPLAVAVMYRRRADASPEALVDGTEVHPGDQLRPCAQGRSGWVSLIGQDSQGIATHYGRWPLAGAALVCAPFAVELDAVPGPERFWLLHDTTADAPIRVTPPPDAVGWRFPKGDPQRR